MGPQWLESRTHSWCGCGPSATAGGTSRSASPATARRHGGTGSGRCRRSPTTQLAIVDVTVRKSGQCSGRVTRMFLSNLSAPCLVCPFAVTPFRGLQQTKRAGRGYFSYLLDSGDGSGGPRQRGPSWPKSNAGARARRFLASGRKPRFSRPGYRPGYHPAQFTPPESHSTNPPGGNVGGFFFFPPEHAQRRVPQGRGADSYARNPRTHAEARSPRSRPASSSTAGRTRSGRRRQRHHRGHGRLAAARKLGLDQVPVIELAHLDRRAKRALVIADNRLALDAGWGRRCWRWSWPTCPRRDTTGADGFRGRDRAAAGGRRR